MLNKSVDRADTLSNHILYLKELEIKEERRLNRLQRKVSEISKILNDQESSLSRLEERFFQNFDRLNAEQAEQDIKIFVDISQKNVTLKAYYGGLTRTQNLHIKFLDIMKKRIQAIKLNQSALIAGERVTQIEDIDLGLIIRK